MADTFQLKIVASDKQFYVGESEEIIFPAIDGLHGVLPHHEAMVTALAAGEVQFKVKGQWNIAVVSDGIAEITPETVIILTDTAEHVEDIDRKRAEEAKERAEERLRLKQSQLEYIHSQAALSRAMARLKAVSKKH